MLSVVYLGDGGSNEPSLAPVRAILTKLRDFNGDSAVSRPLVLTTTCVAIMTKTGHDQQQTMAVCSLYTGIIVRVIFVFDC